jgi:alanine-glyoxylate transaminase/serine-glyoxylate transaminase/serine-pyruvate transaminase
LGVLVLTFVVVPCKLQLLGALAGVELSLQDVGYPVTLGSGVAAAQAHLQRATPLITSRI